MSRRGPSLFVAYSGASGGAGRFLADIASGLDGPVVVACPPGPVADACRERRIPVILIRARPLRLRGGTRVSAAAAAALAGHAREVRRLVRELDPALVFTWGMRPGLAMAGALTGLPRRPPWLARHHDFLPGPAVGAAVRRALGRADGVVVNSQAVARDLALGRAVAVILPGVDLERFTPAPGRVDDHVPVVLWLGAIVGWKRPDLAIEVAERLPEVRLRLGGAPLDEDGRRLLASLRERADRAGLADRVELAGQLDPVAALREADVLLHTADREPFGIAVAEALAAGVPVVAANAGGPAEVVDDTCGRLFEPGHGDGAARALGEVLAARAQLALGARARAEELLDLDRARGRYDALVRRHRDTDGVAAGEAPGVAEGDRPGVAPGEPHGAGITLVTVTHDSSAELEALLASIARNLPGALMTVVDSGSSDDSAAVARRHGAEVVELANVGYGPAANAGVTLATTPVTVVLNPDVELVDDSLADVAHELLRAGAPERLVVPAVLLSDGSRQDVAQREPATAALVPLALVPPAVLPRRLRVVLEPWRADRPRRAGWPVGACIAARTETLRRLGPFDPEAFLYGEDLDLGLRARDAGVETWFWPAARVVHRRAHSTSRAFGGEPFELLARRRREVIAARRGRARLLFDDVLQAVTFADRLAVKTVLRRDTTRERRLLAALRTARRRA